MLNWRRLLLVFAVLGVVVGVLWFQRADDLPAGFQWEARHLWSHSARGGFLSDSLREKIHLFSASHPGRGTTPLRLDGGTICWSYSNPTSLWFAFGDLVGQSNLFYWELALPQARTLTGALAELPTTTFHGLDSNYWAKRVGTGNVAFNARSVGQGAIRVETGTVVFARHIQRTNVVEVVHVRNFKEGPWGDVVAEFAIGSVQDTLKGRR